MDPATERGRRQHVVPVVDLEGRVPDREAGLEQLLDDESPLVAVDALVDQHVRGQRREPRRHLPDVQLVDVGHARDASDGGLDRARVDRPRGCLQEDPRGNRIIISFSIMSN